MREPQSVPSNPKKDPLLPEDIWLSGMLWIQFAFGVLCAVVLLCSVLKYAGKEGSPETLASLIIAAYATISVKKSWQRNKQRLSVLADGDTGDLSNERSHTDPPVN